MGPPSVEAWVLGAGGGGSPSGPGFKSRRPHHGCRPLVLRCSRPLCPGLLRERVLLAYLGLRGVDVVPRLLSDIWENGQWSGFTRCWINGYNVARLVVDALIDGNVGEAEALVGRAARILAKLHDVLLRCRAPFCTALRRRDWCRSVVSWRGFLWALGFRTAADALAAVDCMDSVGSLAVLGHGDPHLGQFIAAGSEGTWVIDFRGEPFRPPQWLFSMHPVERDVAVLLRSIDYAVVLALGERSPGLLRRLCNAAVEAYEGAAARRLSRRGLLFWMAERAGYEAYYEYRMGSGLMWVPVSWLESRGVWRLCL